MDWRSRLLWIDGLGGAVVGVGVLLTSSWLAEWHQLPRDFLVLMGAANLAYAAYSLSLAVRARRSRQGILLLVAANLTWAVLCLRWATVFSATLSLTGFIHLVGEGLFVGGLALLEWRWRDLLANPARS